MRIEDVNLQEVMEREAGAVFKGSKNKSTNCMFHGDKNPSLFIHPSGKFFKCFGCGKVGNVLTFMRDYCGLDYKETCERLGVEMDKEYMHQLEEEEKIKNYINWQILNLSDYKKFTLIEMYKFVDKDNNTQYYKAKFKTENGKQLRYYSIDEDGKVHAKRNSEELPYNLYYTLRAIKKGKEIFIVEGEKDAQNLNVLGFTATSIKNVNNKDFDFSVFQGAKINVIGDTGEAGQRYIDEVYKNVYKFAKSYKVIKLTGLEALGDNKDVTDWLQDGHNEEELRKCIYKSLDLKNIYELQQNNNGIYKTIIKETKDGIQKKIHYITNFNILSSINTRFVDEEKEGIELLLKSQDGEIFTRIGEVNVFNDVRSFKNFLGTMALTFSGKMEDLDNLKNWIYRYFTDETQSIYTGIQFKNNMLIAPTGAITSEGINKKIFCKSNSQFNLNNELLSKDEAIQLSKHLFKFNKEEYCTAILGTIIHNFAIEKAFNNNIKLHHLLLIGESGSGKSTTKESIINPILGYSSSNVGTAIKNVTKFALTKKLSDGNYTKIFDEYKPSEMRKDTCDMINDMLKNTYDRNVAERGNKDKTTSEYKLACPVVLCGEEGFKNNDKASIERSLIVYLSKFERPQGSAEALEWLQHNEALLNKLGSTLLKRILSMTNEEYLNIRTLYKGCNMFGFKDRLLNTFINACVGMHLIEETFEKIIGERVEVLDFIDGIANIIKENVMQNGEEKTSIYEDMLLKINDMVTNEPYLREDTNTYKIYIDKDKTFIRVNLIVDDLNRYKKVNGLDIPLLNKNDFIKQCQKSGYILRSNINKKIGGKVIKTYEFDIDKLYKLGCTELIGRGIADKKQREEEMQSKNIEVVEQEQQKIL